MEGPQRWRYLGDAESTLGIECPQNWGVSVPKWGRGDTGGVPGTWGLCPRDWGLSEGLGVSCGVFLGSPLTISRRSSRPARPPCAPQSPAQPGGSAPASRGSRWGWGRNRGQGGRGTPCPSPDTPQIPSSAFPIPILTLPKILTPPQPHFCSSTPILTPLPAPNLDTPQSPSCSPSPNPDPPTEILNPSPILAPTNPPVLLPDQYLAYSSSNLSGIWKSSWMVPHWWCLPRASLIRISIWWESRGSRRVLVCPL